MPAPDDFIRDAVITKAETPLGFLNKRRYPSIFNPRCDKSGLKGAVSRLY
jgi:hypothetical protein